jgi:hypothetical protein
VRKALGLYGPVVQAAATDHLNTADLWSAIRDAAEEAGLASPGVSAATISSLRGIYGRMTTAAENLARANPEDPVTGAMIGQAPWSPDLEVQAATPAYLATFRLATVSEDGAESSRWVTTRIVGGIGTVGDLNAMIGADAAGAAAGYGERFAGWDALSVVAGL